MTVHSEIPLVRYVGNDTTTDFSFTWTSMEHLDIYVVVNDVLLEAGIDYELTDYKTGYGPDDDGGGVIVFVTPPAATDNILIYRQTPITQEVDYLETQPFPAETHESQLDKDTLILQEISHGIGTTIGGPVDLESIEKPLEVEIDNTGGENAHIQLWECQLDLSGVFAGEVTFAAPADGTPSTKPEGYMYFEITP